MHPASYALLLLAATACTGAGARPDSAAAKATDEPTDTASTQAAATQGTDPRVARADLARIAGAPGAALWLLVVSDFQCPYCREYHQTTAKQVQQEFVETGKVRMAYINFPLRQHANALPAAEAAMCAGAQDRFWPYHDRLFETVDTWGPSASPLSAFEGIATDLQLDTTAFRQCMADHVMQPMIQADYERGVQSGTNSTPTFLIGSRRLTGNAPIAALRSAINEQLQGSK
jgi:protein-disulfide isomerase